MPHFTWTRTMELVMLSCLLRVAILRQRVYVLLAHRVQY